MVLTGDVTAMLMPQGGYTSCIKINGIPILPPLVTAAKRLELQVYKKKAIEIEHNLKSQQDMKAVHNGSRTEPQDRIKNASHNTTLEHLLSFGSDNSHIHALGISDISKVPSEDCKTVVPLTKHKFTNLTCNIFDVSEYSDNGVVIFKRYNQNETKEQERQLSASTVELELSETVGECNKESPPLLSNCSATCPEEAKKFDLSTPSKSEHPKPRLLRSNSYTLESPSPVLLEHLRKQAEQDPNSSYEFEKYTGPQRRSLDLGSSNCRPIVFDNTSAMAVKSSKKAVSTPTKLNSNPKIVKSAPNPMRSQSIHSKSFSSPVTSIYKHTKLDSNSRNLVSSPTNSNYNPQSSESDNNNQKSCDSIYLDSISHVVQDLAQKHFGAVNEGSKVSTDNTTVKEVKEKRFLNPQEQEDEDSLQELLIGMPESCAKDIMELLQKHKKQQEIKVTSYNAFKQKFVSENVRDSTSTELSQIKSVEIDLQYMEFDPLSPSPRIDRKDKQVNVTSHYDDIKSCSNVNSPTDTLNPFNTSTPLLIDFESDSCDNEPLPHFYLNSSHSNSDPLHV